MFDGVVQDVLERLVVLLFRLDHLRPEAAAKDVVLPTVTLVEGSRVLSVQVAHAVGQVCQRRFDEQVVVVPEQAACVKPPAVAAPHPAQQLHEDAAVPVVEEDRRVVVPFRPDVVVGAHLEVTVWSSHAPTVTAGGAHERRAIPSGTRSSRTRHVPGTRHG